MSVLADRFYIPLQILDTKVYNNCKKSGSSNPFLLNNQVIICSYNFAAINSLDIKTVDWDIVIIDEVYRLRNVYKPTTRLETNELIRNTYLKKCLEPFYKKTLRKQVTEYVSQTQRIPMLQEYLSSKEEDRLYNKVMNIFADQHLLLSLIVSVF